MITGWGWVLLLCGQLHSVNVNLCCDRCIVNIIQLLKNIDFGLQYTIISIMVCYVISSFISIFHKMTDISEISGLVSVSIEGCFAHNLYAILQEYSSSVMSTGVCWNSVSITPFRLHQTLHQTFLRLSAHLESVTMFFLHLHIAIVSFLFILFSVWWKTTKSATDCESALLFVVTQDDSSILMLRCSFIMIFYDFIMNRYKKKKKQAVETISFKNVMMV